MAKINSFRDLLVWRKGMDLTEVCYRMTDRFPRAEMFGLTSQIRRAAVSIVSNLAEGHNRRSLASYLNHVSIALGSQAELETQLDLSVRLGFCSASEAQRVVELANEVGRMLHGLAASLERLPPSA